MTPHEVKLAALVLKLKDKSIYPRLVRLSEGKTRDCNDEMVAVSSLLTHALLEVKIDKTYRGLVSNLYKKLGLLISKLKEN
jgi:hypothetical protein